MHARVITATVEPGRLDEVVNALQETVLDKIKHRQGFKNAFVLTDPTNNKVMAISFWEEKAHLDAHVAAGRSLWEGEIDLDTHVAAGRIPKHHVEAARAVTAPYVEEYFEVNVQE